jgi:hypothetical protein
MLPFGKEVVVMEGAGGKLIRMVKDFVALCGGLLESVTVTVKLGEVPFGPEGVPVIRPVLLFKLSPAGMPTPFENVSVPWPPVTAIGWL